MKYILFAALTCLMVLTSACSLISDDKPSYLTGDNQNDASGQPTAVSLLTPLATYTPVNTPTSTFTPTPTNTPTNTPTPTKTPTVTPTPTPTIDPAPTTLEIGRSVLNKPIEAVRMGNGENAVILIGGLHAGFAPSTVQVALDSITHFSNHPEEIPSQITLYIIPSANPDSPYASNELAGRLNANSVDLNRNWPCEWVRDAEWRNSTIKGSGGTAPFSEPETQSLSAFIENVQPTAVIFWEAIYRDSAGNGLSSPGACGSRTQVSGELATIYGEAAYYNIGDFERGTGQIVNGDGANWLDDQGFPTIAVLLPHHENVTDWDDQLAGITAVLQTHAQNNN